MEQGGLNGSGTERRFAHARLLKPGASDSERRAVQQARVGILRNPASPDLPRPAPRDVWRKWPRLRSQRRLQALRGSEAANDVDEILTGERLRAFSRSLRKPGTVPDVGGQDTAALDTEAFDTKAPDVMDIGTEAAPRHDAPPARGQTPLAAARGAMDAPEDECAPAPDPQARPQVPPTRAPAADGRHRADATPSPTDPAVLSPDPAHRPLPDQRTERMGPPARAAGARRDPGMQQAVDDDMRAAPQDSRPARRNGAATPPRPAPEKPALRSPEHPAASTDAQLRRVPHAGPPPRNAGSATDAPPRSRAAGPPPGKSPNTPAAPDPKAPAPRRDTTPGSAVAMPQADQPRGAPEARIAAPVDPSAQPTANQPDEDQTPQAAQPATPQAAQPATPQAAQPATPQAAQPATPQAAQPATPQAAQPATPEAAQPAEALGHGGQGARASDDAVSDSRNAPSHAAHAVSATAPANAPATTARATALPDAQASSGLDSSSGLDTSGGEDTSGNALAGEPDAWPDVDENRLEAAFLQRSEHTAQTPSRVPQAQPRRVDRLADDTPTRRTPLVGLSISERVLLVLAIVMLVAMASGVALNALLD